MNKMMKKIGTRLAILTIAGTALIGGESVINATPAEAATTSSCRLIDAGYGRSIGWTGHRYGAYCYVNYDWAEEFFGGNRDGYKFVNTSNNKCHLVPWLGYRPWGC